MIRPVLAALTMPLAALSMLLAASPARADITIGALLSLTGPGAGLGIPERNTIALLPKMIAGQAVSWVVLDDASDTTAAVRAARKMIEEDHVDAILGASTTPNSLAILDAIGADGVPAISLAGSSAVIEPPQGARRWAFKLIPSERVATVQIVDHMLGAGKKTLGHIGFANALGDGYINALNAQAAARGIQTVAETRYNPGDASVTPQVLRLIAARPDAIFVAASSAPAATPILELRARGYAGPIYTVQGIAGPDALRVGGKALDGVMFSSVPVLVAEQMPDAHPVKAPAMAYVAAYEARYGAGSRSLFGATLWDGFLLIQAAAPAALHAGPPGTTVFRTALRDAMESVQGLAASEAVFTMTPADHSGARADSQVMVEIRDGAYRVLPQ
jgi:branched-chain amino acid transport system substrate-binding protein